MTYGYTFCAECKTMTCHYGQNKATQCIRCFDVMDNASKLDYLTQDILCVNPDEEVTKEIVDFLLAKVLAEKRREETRRLMQYNGLTEGSVN